MKKAISAVLALAAASSVAVAAIPAQADSFGGGRHHFRGHQAYGGGYGYRNRGGRGHWHNGRWIALGVGAAIIAGAAAASQRDCYWRNGYRYCD